MSNDKSRGIDGKQHRKKTAVKSVVQKESLPSQVDIDCAAQSFCCVRGDELKQNGFAVSFANCIGNIFSEKDPVCKECGVCERISRAYPKLGLSYLADLILEEESDFISAVI
ncbi:MAG: hypothetical protein WC120_03545 [Parcubacteria group bacterium]